MLEELEFQNLRFLTAGVVYVGPRVLGKNRDGDLANKKADVQTSNSTPADDWSNDHL